jgi:putative ABC transport system ATP-binding protein
VDLVIDDGDWLAIQGPTGHGKSTLLQILGALDRPTSGTVQFGGHDSAVAGRAQRTGLMKDGRITVAAGRT